MALIKKPLLTSVLCLFHSVEFDANADEPFTDKHGLGLGSMIQLNLSNFIRLGLYN